MPLFIRYDCVINTPLHALIERLEDHTIYNAATRKFVALAAGTPPPATTFVPLQMNVPLPHIHASTVNTADATQFIPGHTFGYYVYNGANRISGLIPAVISGSKVVVTIDGQAVFSSP
jgi:hypothetical protein